MITGTCLCGAVRYEIDGPVDLMMNCHCSMCRKHHGSAFATFVTAPLQGFRWLSGENAVRSYASSTSGHRPFCGICGSVAPMLWPAMQLLYALEGFRFTSGAAQVIDYKLGDARFFGTAFCGRCGAMVPRVSRERALVVVPAGSLDVDPGVRPMMQICVASKASWVEITDTVTPQFAEAPPPSPALAARH